MPGTPAEEMARSEAVLAGRVVRMDAPRAPIIGTADPVRVVFQVERVWKGPAYHTVVIVTARHEVSCGYPFEVGQQYLVYAYASEGELHTNICNRTSPLAAAGPGMTLVPEDPTSPATDAWAAVPLILFIAALVPLSILSVWWIRRMGKR